MSDMGDRPLAVGDIVMLKTLSPRMTVEQIVPVDTTPFLAKVVCVWFRDGLLVRDSFVIDTLRLDSES